jgi:hypothetical protein
LFITPFRASLGPRLLSALENADYSIIPRSSLDPNGSIRDYRNTSGPYYVDRDSPNGAWVLRANPKHYAYDIAMPQEIRIVPAIGDEGLKRLLDGDVDLITSTDLISGPNAEKIIADRERFAVHETLPFKITLACFSPRALSDFTAAQRFYAAGIVAKAIRKIVPTVGAIETTEFFQTLSDGSLNKDQLDEIKNLRRERSDAPELPRTLKVGFSAKLSSIMQKELAGHHQFEVIEIKQPGFLMPLAERPDMFFGQDDSAWTENLGLLGHNIEAGVFQFPDVDLKKWLSRYIEEDDKERRMAALNKLHFDLLRAASFYPFEASPYHILGRGDLALNQSTLHTGNELWRIRKKR